MAAAAGAGTCLALGGSERCRQDDVGKVSMVDDTSSRTHVEVVQTCAVDLDEDLSGADLGLGCVLGDGDLGGVGVLGDHKRAHLGCSIQSVGPAGWVGCRRQTRGRREEEAQEREDIGTEQNRSPDVRLGLFYVPTPDPASFPAGLHTTT